MSQVRTNSIVPVGGIPAGASGGGIIQVVQTIKSDIFTTSTSGSGSFVSITGLSASITPRSASNKVLIFCDIQAAGASHVNTLCSFRVLRGGSTISASLGDSRANFFQSSVLCLRAANDTNSSFRFPFMFLDSPATTSSTTYQLQGQAEAHGFHINRTAQDAASNNFSATSISTITLMEVSG